MEVRISELLNLLGRYFDRFVMMIIFINSICLAAYDYDDRDEKRERN